MFDRLSIRTKLIAIVAAPLAVIIGLAGLGYTQRSDEASGTRADAVRLEAIVAAQTLQHEIQLESLYSVAFLAGPEGASTDGLVAQQEKVDAASATLQGTMAQVDPADPAQDAAVSAGRAVDQVAKTLRRQVVERSLDWTWVENLYRNALASLPPLNGRLVDGISDGALADGAGTVVALGEYTTSQARIGVILAGAGAVDGFPDVLAAAAAAADDPEAEEPTDSGVSTRSVFADAVDRAEVELAVVSSQAGSRVRASLRNRMVGGDLSYFSDSVARVRALAPTDPVGIDPARWTSAVEDTLEQLRSIAGAEADTVLATAAERVDSADRAARLFLGGAALAVLAALALAISVATSIARPVMSLTAAADRVANEQLPKLVDALRDPSDSDSELMRPDMEEIDVKGGKELAKLSASVSQIQEVAVNVATEQATMLRKGIGDMFINLARRNQGLLDRQLEFIDELEAQEDDPDQLEHLFKLDHMATRMRRNAESLLVLAGAEPGRRRGKPVPLTKVALAAVGEIEHFARIDLLDVDESEVISSAAADLAHLLSELMENATQFSPPDSRVEVVGHGNNGGGYTISITDQGIGMSAEQLADGNALLTRPPLLGLTLARTLGFIVVGRLATRHGITVRLVPSPAGGVTAIVSIPSNVLVPQLDTLDLSDPVADGYGGPSGGGPVGSSAPAGGSVKETIATPSAILPPFEFYTGPMDDEPTYDEPTYDEPAAFDDPAPAPYEEPAAFDGADPFSAPSPFAGSDPFAASAPSAFDAAPVVDEPATLEEAVPTGDAFDEGLAAVADGPEPLIGASPPPAAAASPLFGPPPAAEPRPLTPTDDRPIVDGEAPIPAGPRLFGSGSGASGRAPSAPPAPPATGGTHLFRPPAPAEAFVPPVPPPSSPTPLPTRTPGPPPGDLLSPPSLPSRAPSAPSAPRPPLPPSAAPTPPLPPRVEPTSPSSLPGEPPAAPPLPTRAPLPVEAPAAPVPPPPPTTGRLPGEPPVAPAASALPGEPPVAPLPSLPTRTPGPTPATPSTNGNGSGPAVHGNGSGPAPAAVAPEVTTAGLVKRVPRRAGGDRAVPGSDGPRRGPTTTSTRSPDEVRAMLSRFHSGKQAGRSPSAAPSFDATPAPSNTEDT